ncbi:hypothetical protein QTP88_003458 [Uroleucon formosanum]
MLVDDCKKRWKNMKDTYNKNKRSRKLGRGSSTKNKLTKWALTDALSFLDVCFYERTEKEDSVTVTVDDGNNSSDSNDFSIMSATENTTVQEIELENNLNTGKTKLLKEKRPTKKVKQNDDEIVSSTFENKGKKKVFNIITNLEIENNSTTSTSNRNSLFSSPNSSLQSSSHSGFSTYDHPGQYIFPDTNDRQPENSPFRYNDRQCE